MGHTGDVPDQTEASRVLESRLGDVLDLLAGLIAVALIAMIDLGRSGLPRILLTAGFAFFVPGRAIVTNWPRVTRWSTTAMSVVLSLATLTLLATVTLWAHFWHPLALFFIEAWLSVVALIAGSLRRHWIQSGAAAASERPAPQEQILD
jgi:cation transport ATPase